MSSTPISNRRRRSTPKPPTPRTPLRPAIRDRKKSRRRKLPSREVIHARQTRLQNDLDLVVVEVPTEHQSAEVEVGNEPINFGPKVMYPPSSMDTVHIVFLMNRFGSKCAYQIFNESLTEVDRRLLTYVDSELEKDDNEEQIILQTVLRVKSSDYSSVLREYQNAMPEYYLDYLKECFRENMPPKPFKDYLSARARVIVGAKTVDFLAELGMWSEIIFNDERCAGNYRDVLVCFHQPQ